MSCYCPSYVWRKVDKLTGSVKTKWLGKLEASEEQEYLYKDYGGYKSMNSERAENKFCRHDVIQVPCGKCIGCRMDYSRSWADRLTYHAIGKDGLCWFITLTYDDDHIEELSVDGDYDLHTLYYDHMTEFIKFLRNKFRDLDIDYFYSGEYGDQLFRCHFHAIIYNLPLLDLVFYKFNDNGDPIYTSEFLSAAWKDRGFVTVAPFTWRSAAYTASYVEKKLDGRRLCEYTAVGLEPERARMSRRPGIAYEYYKQHAVDLWNNDGLSVGRDVNANGHLGVSRYFRKLADQSINPDSELYDLDVYRAYLGYKERSLDKFNIINPCNVDNSSFDLDNVSTMLKFEQREILSKRKQKKL